MEDQCAGLLVIHGIAQNVRRQQIAGELDALITEPENPGQGMGQGGLAHARNVLDQEVATGQQAAQGKANLSLLAQQDAVERGDRIVDQRFHARISLSPA